MRARLLGIFLVSMLLLSGCLGALGGDGEGQPEATEGDGSNASEAEVASNPDARESSAKAKNASAGTQEGPADALFPNATEIQGNTTVDDWFALTAKAGPSAPVSAFRWEIPEDAVVPDAFFQEYMTTVVDVVPFSANETTVTSWGVFFFDLSEENATLLSAWTSPTVQIRSVFGPTSGTQTITPALSSFQTYIGFNGLEEGDDVGIAVAVESGNKTDVGIGLRALSEDPGFEGQPPRDIDDLREDENGTAPLRVPHTGSGNGFQTSYFNEYYSSFLYGAQIWTPGMRIEDEAPLNPQPVASVRQNTLGLGFDTDEGWGYGSSYYFSYAAAGQWSVDANVYNQQLQADGPFVQANTVPFSSLATSLLLGYPSHVIMGSGEGGSQVQFTVSGASVNEFEILTLYQTDLGVTIEELFGQRSSEYAYTYTGVTGQAPSRAAMHWSDGWTQIHQPGAPSLGFRAPNPG